MPYTLPFLLAQVAFHLHALSSTLFLHSIHVCMYSKWYSLWETTLMKDHLFCKTSSAGHKCSIYAPYSVPPHQRPPLLQTTFHRSIRVVSQRGIIMHSRGTYLDFKLAYLHLQIELVVAASLSLFPPHSLQAKTRQGSRGHSSHSV